MFHFDNANDFISNFISNAVVEKQHYIYGVISFLFSFISSQSVFDIAFIQRLILAALSGIFGLAGIALSVVLSFILREYIWPKLKQRFLKKVNF